MSSSQRCHDDPLGILKDTDDTYRRIDDHFGSFLSACQAIPSMSEMNKEIKDLTLNINMLKEKYYEKEINERKIRTHLQEITKSNENDYKEIQELSEQVIQLERRCNSHRDCTISSPDREILRLARKKLSLYKEITGISWDFSVPPHLVKGFIKNKERMYINPFKFNKNEMPQSKIKELLYQEISKASSVDWSDIDKNQ